MATTRAELIIQAKDQASDQLQQIFQKVTAAQGINTTAIKALNETHQQTAKIFREQADAASRGVNANYTLAKGYTDMANSLEGNNQGLRLFGFNVVDVAAKLYLLQVGVRNVIQALQGIFELAEIGAQVQQQEEAFRRLVTGAGKDYLVYMEELRKASGGVITDFELQRKTSDALIGTQGK